MIEKIERVDDSFVDKINELIDAVNELQKHSDRLSCAILDLATPDGENKALKSLKAEPKTSTDPYAEQRKWIGKLCWFWDDDKNEKNYAILTGINPKNVDFEGKKCPYIDDNEDWYVHCEPVKDDIIYKGE